METDYINKLVHEATEAIISTVEKNSATNEKIIKTAREQLLIKSIAIGNMMAPTLYGNRLHGEAGAVSATIRACSEALFWLEFIRTDTTNAFNSVNKLKEFLVSPGI